MTNVFLFFRSFRSVESMLLPYTLMPMSPSPSGASSPTWSRRLLYCRIPNAQLGWFQMLFNYFSPFSWGNDPISTLYFSPQENGVVQVQPPPPPPSITSITYHVIDPSRPFPKASLPEPWAVSTPRDGGRGFLQRWRGAASHL